LVEPRKYLELLMEMISKKAKPGDNFMMELRHHDMSSSISCMQYSVYPRSLSLWTEVKISYSRYNSGGSYEALCSIYFHDGVIEMYKYSHFLVFFESFELASPDCFDRLIDEVIKKADAMQTNRSRSSIGLPNVWEKKI
jgi:hypothetical protein